MLADRILASVSQESTSTLTCDLSRCLRMRYSESGCEYCTTVCPSQAIDLSDGLRLHRERCTGCLACTTACPSGTLEASTDFSRLQQALTNHQQDTFVLGCQRNETNQANHQLPCLGMLSLEHLLVLTVATRTALQLDISQCGGCSSKGMLTSLRSHLAQATELQPSSLPIRLISDADQLHYRSETLDRRAFFNSFRRLTALGVKSVLSPPEPELKQRSYADKLLPRRRSLLLTIKDQLAPQAAATVTYQASFSDACSGCLGCVRICPTGALSTPCEQVFQDHTTPVFTADCCTGCGLCVEFCLDQAVTLHKQP